MVAALCTGPGIFGVCVQVAKLNGDDIRGGKGPLNGQMETTKIFPFPPVICSSRYICKQKPRGSDEGIAQFRSIVKSFKRKSFK